MSRRRCGLLALMLLQDSRRDARQGEAGELVVLARAGSLALGSGAHCGGAGRAGSGVRAGSGRPVPASGCHRRRSTLRRSRPADTDWPQIVALYDQLLAITPSPVVALNRAVAVAQSGDPETALRIVDALAGEGELGDYYLLHSTRGELLRRLGRPAESAAEFARARDLATNDVERAYLEFAPERGHRAAVAGSPTQLGPYRLTPTTRPQTPVARATAVWSGRRRGWPWPTCDRSSGSAMARRRSNSCPSRLSDSS